MNSENKYILYVSKSLKEMLKANIRKSFSCKVKSFICYLYVIWFQWRRRDIKRYFELRCAAKSAQKRQLQQLLKKYSWRNNEKNNEDVSKLYKKNNGNKNEGDGRPKEVMRTNRLLTTSVKKNTINENINKESQ